MKDKKKTNSMKVIHNNSDKEDIPESKKIIEDLSELLIKIEDNLKNKNEDPENNTANEFDEERN